jgi:hypothetical protein
MNDLTFESSFSSFPSHFGLDFAIDCIEFGDCIILLASCLVFFFFFFFIFFFFLFFFFCFFF